MGEYADDEIDRWADSGEPFGSRNRPFVPVHVKQKNQKVFSAFARDGSNFKAGDRVVHMPSGTAGEVIATRGTQICWKPDSRFKAGGVWVDSDKLRFDI